MDKRYAAKLHNEDEVTVKKGNWQGTVIETNVIRDASTGKINSVEVMLDDGNWYGHKEIS